MTATVAGCSQAMSEVSQFSLSKMCGSMRHVSKGQQGSARVGQGRRGPARAGQGRQEQGSGWLAAAPTYCVTRTSVSIEPMRAVAAWSIRVSSMGGYISCVSTSALHVEEREGENENEPRLGGRSAWRWHGRAAPGQQAQATAQAARGGPRVSPPNVVFPGSPSSHRPRRLENGAERPCHDAGSFCSCGVDHRARQLRGQRLARPEEVDDLGNEVHALARAELVVGVPLQHLHRLLVVRIAGPTGRAGMQLRRACGVPLPQEPRAGARGKACHQPTADSARRPWLT